MFSFMIMREVLENPAASSRVHCSSKVFIACEQLVGKLSLAVKRSPTENLSMIPSGKIIGLIAGLDKIIRQNRVLCPVKTLGLLWHRLLFPCN